MNVPFNAAPQGWQCPCCKTIYAPSVTTCAPCSGAAPHIPIALPAAPGTEPLPPVWEPPYTGTPYVFPFTTCDSVTIARAPDGGWLINGQPAQITPTYGAN